MGTGARAAGTGAVTAPPPSVVEPSDPVLGPLCRRAHEVLPDGSGDVLALPTRCPRGPT
jgi:hypothetical protein